jgi:predicted  nucleic acid-binding Zn-ribbon protein
MAEQGRSYKIQGLRRRWIIYQVLEDVLYSLYAALYVGALVYYLLSPSLLWGIITFPVVLAIMLGVNRPWQMSDDKIAAFLNREYPELQESSQLLLVPAEELNPLQVIASSKTAAVLAGLKVSHKPFAKRLVVAFVSLIVATGFIWALGKIFHIERIFYGPDRPVAVCAPGAMAEKVLPQINSIEVSIAPPAYTGKAKRTQDKFNLSAEEGAVVIWNIKTNVAIKKASLIFNDKEQVKLESENKHTDWYATKAIDKPGFYQVNIDGKLSDLYYVQVIKDGVPVIHIKSPKQYTYIE